MSQKLRFHFLGPGPIKFGLKTSYFELKSQNLGYKKLQIEEFVPMTSNWFIGSLLSKFACPTTDYHLLTSRFLRFPVFIGQQ